MGQPGTCYVMFVGRSERLADLAGGTVLEQRHGFTLSAVAVPPPAIESPTYTQLAEHAAAVLALSPDPLTSTLTDEGNWIPVLERTAADATASMTFGWDGALLHGTPEHVALARTCLVRSLIHWFAMGELLGRARDACESSKVLGARQLRAELARASLLLDPRRETCWEIEYVWLEQIRLAWRTDETQKLTEQLLHDLEFLAQVEGTRRLQLLLGTIAIIGSIGALPAIIDFATANTGLTPSGPARPLLGAAMVLVVVWLGWRLRKSD